METLPSAPSPIRQIPVGLNHAVGLTDRQRFLLDFLVRHQRTNGYFPAVREIGAAMGIKSPNGVMCYLHALTKKGYLVHRYGGGKNAYTLAAAPGCCPTCGQRIPEADPADGVVEQESIQVGDES